MQHFLILIIRGLYFVVVILHLAMNGVRTLVRTTLVVIGTDCTGRCKSNYHKITTTTVPSSKSLGLVPHVYINGIHQFLFTNNNKGCTSENQDFLIGTDSTKCPPTRIPELVLCDNIIDCII